jgi:DnaA family protein
MQQLALDLQLAEFALFDTFYPGPNAAVVAAAEQASTTDGQQVHWIWGAAGAGRSHLLQAAVAAASNAGYLCAWLPLGAPGLEPGMLVGLGGLDLLCIDDIDAVAGDAAWEGPLFTVCEELRTNNGRLLVTAGVAMREAGFALPDLASRLAAGPTWKLQSLDDEDRVHALQLRSRWRGLELPTETARFLLRRIDRSNNALFSMLDRLDKAALIAQRRLTIPFVKSVLEDEVYQGE